MVAWCGYSKTAKIIARVIEFESFQMGENDSNAPGTAKLKPTGDTFGSAQIKIGSECSSATGEHELKIGECAIDVGLSADDTQTSDIELGSKPGTALSLARVVNDDDGDI